MTCSHTVLKSLRARVEALDPYTGIGARGEGLANSDATSAPVYAYRDAVLDMIDEAMTDEEKV